MLTFDKVHALPLTVKVDNFTVYILEVMKYRLPNGKESYVVTCKIKKDDFETRSFPIFCRDTNELRAKLLIEVTKIRYLMWLHGKDFAKRVASG
ncbi:MAG: hypothetical protein DRJ60_00405 [Thermoprotei archaeon]|nr:MAG: hypothetical protein DRJ60_00405 [Thermoprotei archaeon]